MSKKQVPQPNFIDKVIEYFAPNTALVRSYARELLDQQFGYEGASMADRLSNWRTAGADAKTSLKNDLPVLRNRSRDLCANDVYANVAKRKSVSNIIGEGIQADIKENDQLADLFFAWAESTDCDVTGEHDLSGLQEIIQNTIFESGSVLVRYRLRRPTRQNPFPLQIQLLEPDHLDVSQDTFGNVKPGQNEIVNGIEFNSLGRPVAYHLFKSHPGDGSKIVVSTDSVRVPASEIDHLFRTDRLGQPIGVPWLAPAIVKLHDFKEYENAQLVRQKMAACFMAFMQVPSNSEALKRFKNKNINGDLIEKVEPALVEMLPPGYEIEFANPPQVGNDYEAYSRTTLRGIAAGTGLPYEVLTGDLSKVNFSSARLGWMEYEKEIRKIQKRIYKSKFLPSLWNRFKVYAELLNYDVTKGTIKWIAPKRALIDPEKEIRAIVAEIRAGLVSHSEAVISLGRDSDQVYDEIEKNNKIFDDKGIIVDSDPRKVTGAGIGQSNDSQVSENQN